MRKQYIRFLSLILSTFILFSQSYNAFSFVEDMCYYKMKSTDRIIPEPFNCWDVQCRDGRDQQQSGSQCLRSGLVTFASKIAIGMGQARSSYHYDTVWLFSSLLGMSPEEAAIIAAYSEATDLASYQHYDYQGKPLGKKTASLDGIVRTSLNTFGDYIHFLPWLKTDILIDRVQIPEYKFSKKYTSPFPQYEIVLNHLRSWAFGKRKQLCEYGITKNLKKEDAPCLSTQDKSRSDKKDMKVTTAVRIGANSKPVYTDLSWQRIRLIENCTGRAGLRKCYEKNYAVSISGKKEALGIYLHAMADRISHKLCLSEASIIEKKSADTHYELIYPSQCGVIEDISNHYRETGATPLPERGRMAIQYTLREINAWMRAMKHPIHKVKPVNSSYPNVDDINKLTNLLADALELDTAKERASRLCEIAVTGYGLKWHDGNPSCKY